MAKGGVAAGASSSSDAVPSAHALGTPATSATWAIAGQERKAGAGVLFFAYGGKQMAHFLSETVTAARSLRAHNPKLAIAVVSNNQTVDPKLFVHHIQPRSDLLFAGSPCPYGPKSCRKDAMPRQWLTRLYYLAHSPFRITWALDSNVISCVPGAAASFLDTATVTDLWGFDIAHANQAQGHRKRGLHCPTFATHARQPQPAIVPSRAFLTARAQSTRTTGTSSSSGTCGRRTCCATGCCCSSGAASPPTTRRRFMRPSSARVRREGFESVKCRPAWRRPSTRPPKPSFHA